MGSDRREAAWRALHGLTAGDALGSQFFVPANRAAFDRRQTPAGPWQWTDDVAASLTASGGPLTPGRLLDAVLEHVPAGEVREGVAEARRLLTVTDPATAAAVLGNGRRVAAHDTVPFCLWSAARHLGDFEAGFWATASAGGDVDTTCAIVGGILAARPGTTPPASWQPHIEPLPPWLRPLEERGHGPAVRP